MTCRVVYQCGSILYCIVYQCQSIAVSVSASGSSIVNKRPHIFLISMNLQCWFVCVWREGGYSQVVHLYTDMTVNIIGNKQDAISKL